MTRAWMVLWVFILIPASAVYGQHSQEALKEMIFKEIVITAPPIEEPLKEKITKNALDFGTYVNMGEVLEAVPGVSAVRRGASATEPVIRGLGWERVQTQVGFVPIYGGCPARMDPPVTYLQPENFQDAEVIKGIPSVTLGPGGTAGRVMVSTDYKRSPEAPPQLGGWVTSTYNGARNGFLGSAGFKGGNKWVDVYGTVNGIDYGDYESADGKTVPADQEEVGGAVSLGFKPRDDHRWSNGIIFVRDNGIEFPSVPMDSEKTTTWIYNTTYRMDFAGKTLERLQVDGGFSLLDHRMSNRNKPNRSTLEAVATTSSDSYAGRTLQDWRLTPSILLTTGLDYYNLERDGMRNRFVVASGKTFIDHIWPDITQWNMGGFSELHIDLANDWHLRAGGRIDGARSEANAVDDTIMAGTTASTIREQFVKYYGPAAADVDRSELLGSGNLLLEWQMIEELTVFVGGGVISRPANSTERYYAFSPAPGGYTLGNPTLDPEIKYELDWGVNWAKPWGLFQLSLFYDWVSDYILPTQIGTLGNLPVRGFKNVDAQLYGGELAVILRAFKHWSLPVSLAYVRGRNTTEGKDLPEIPPLEVRAAVRAEYGKKVPWWVEFGGRFAASQHYVDESFPEDETAAFAVFHLYGGLKPVKGLKLIAGIDNLFNTEYSEHLTREAVFSVGDLVAGEEIPAPGISFFAAARYEF
ncbi:TonB-dependent receptor domain-containing protein [Desulfoferrobacter suflitae]|uniref:TonB-dependent receptor domain-containing protein n=1 Tax=Desulfoferrobacter suflitae TaxID=2865782 RepID=UPI0021645C8E|nr:TonB-dependent receptor [Desulfoferrobacter suflitae]MCK8600961.1 TonB-dependent receptor [Desulfoferrobacter suflitae]